MTLGEYLTYNNDENINKIFASLYTDLEVINRNELIVTNLDADHIYLDEKTHAFKFEDNFSLGDEDSINDNLTALTKIFLGSYFNSQAGYRDFSRVSTDWIKDSFDEIKDTVTDQNFPEDYFRRVFDGEIIYYNNYIDNKKEIIKGAVKKYKREITKSNKAFILRELLPAILLSITVIVLVVLAIIR